MGAATDDVFRAIADPTRRGILAGLARGPRTVSEICEDFRISQPSVSAHLEVLRRTDLVRVRIDGRQRVYSLNLGALDEVSEWLAEVESFWKHNLKRLGDILDEDHRSPSREKKRGKRGA